MRDVFTRRWSGWLIPALLCLPFTAVAQPAAAPTKAEAVSGPCSAPRLAAQTFLDNLQPDRNRPQEAVACFEFAPDTTAAGKHRLVRDFKAVLDARGLYVQMDELPDANDYRDKDGRHRVLLVRGFENAWLVRRGKTWLFPRAVVERIPVLYEKTFTGWLEGTLQRLPAVFRAKVIGVEIWQYIGFLLLLILSTLVGGLTRIIVFNRLAAVLARIGVKDAATRLKAAAGPMALMIAAFTFLFLLPELRLPITFARVLAVLAKVTAAITGVGVAYRMVELLTLRFEMRARETESKLDDQLVMVTQKALRAIVVAVGIVFVLQNLDVDVGSLLAGFGLGGLAFALAAKDTAANLFGSLTIFLDRPFHIGDWIVAAGVEGTVEEVGLRSTRVRTFYNSEVTVPNSALATTNVDNMGRREYRRVKQTLGIGYHSTPDQIQAFVEGVRAVIQAHPDTRKDYFEVHFVGFGESSLNIMMYCFVKVDSWSDELRAKQQLFLEIVRLAHDLKVEFAFPTRTLHIESQANATDRSFPPPPETDAMVATVEGFGPGGNLSRPGGPKLTHGFLARTGQRGSGEGE